MPDGAVVAQEKSGSDWERAEMKSDADMMMSGAALNEFYQKLSKNSPLLAPVFRVVLTGGPCAGKTTALAVLEERMGARGFRVFVVPEAATALISGGARFQELTTPERVKIFQATLLKTQVALEESFLSIARMCGQPSVVICDRGVMDGAAYMEPGLWSEMLEENDWNTVALRDQRYDAILHLVTAAEGARKYYSLENNKTRHESVEDAIALDRKLRNAWIGHPRLRVIDNRTDFPEKISRVMNALCSLVGLPQSPEVARKFLASVDIPRLISTVGMLQEFDVDQTVLLSASKDVQETVRRRGNHGKFSYVHRVRRVGVRGEDTELKRNINEREYLTLLAHANPSKRSVRICRRCFLYHDTYFVIDEIVNIDHSVTLLRTNTDSADTPIEVPAFITLHKEVTNDETYSIHRLCRKVNPIRRFEYEKLSDLRTSGSPSDLKLGTSF